MSKPAFDPELGAAFLAGAGAHYKVDQGNGPKPACWLWQFDEEPCAGDKLEAIHLLRKQTIRNVLGPQLTGASRDGAPIPAFGRADIDALVAAAEYDDRNGMLACPFHHHRFDSHDARALVVPPAALPLQTLIFFCHWGLEQAAEDQFPGDEGEQIKDVLELRREQIERPYAAAT